MDRNWLRVPISTCFYLVMVGLVLLRFRHDRVVILTTVAVRASAVRISMGLSEPGSMRSTATACWCSLSDYEVSMQLPWALVTTELCSRWVKTGIRVAVTVITTVSGRWFTIVVIDIVSSSEGTDSRTLIRCTMAMLI